MGTRYVLELASEKGVWRINLMFGTSIEEYATLRALNRSDLQQSIREVLKHSNIGVNDFQIEMMTKDLYNKDAGNAEDTDSKGRQLNSDSKRRMTEDGTFAHELAAEFKNIAQQPASPPARTPPARQPAETREMLRDTFPEPTRSEPEPLDTSTGFTPVSEAIEKDNRPSHPGDRDEIKSLLNELLSVREKIQADMEAMFLRLEKVDEIIFKINAWAKS